MTTDNKFRLAGTAKVVSSCLSLTAAGTIIVVVCVIAQAILKSFLSTAPMPLILLVWCPIFAVILGAGVRVGRWIYRKLGDRFGEPVQAEPVIPGEVHVTDVHEATTRKMTEIEKQVLCAALRLRKRSFLVMSVVSVFVLPGMVFSLVSTESGGFRITMVMGLLCFVGLFGSLAVFWIRKSPKLAIDFRDQLVDELHACIRKVPGGFELADDNSKRIPVQLVNAKALSDMPDGTKLVCRVSHKSRYLLSAVRQSQ
jgi:hypothetical protein